MSFALSNTPMNNLSNDIVFTTKQLVDNMLSFITFNARASAGELNSNLKKKISINIMPFNLDLSKQALEVTFARTTRSYHLQTCFNVIFECLPAYFSKKCSN